MRITRRQIRRIIREEKEMDINLYEALDAYISEAIQAAIDETGADPNLPAVRSTIEKALNAYITRNYR